MRESQLVERASLSGIISEASERIKQLRTSKNELAKEQLKFEAEVGPIRYVAEFIYGETNQQILEK